MPNSNMAQNIKPSYVVSIISRFVSKPSKLYLAAAKHIFRYVQGTKNYLIIFEAKEDNKLQGFSYSD